MKNVLFNNIGRKLERHVAKCQIYGFQRIERRAQQAI